MTDGCKHEHGWDIEMRCPACAELRHLYHDLSAYDAFEMPDVLRARITELRAELWALKVCGVEVE